MLIKKIQINKMRDEMGFVARNTKEIQRIIGTYFKKPYSNRFENVKKQIIFLIHTTYQSKIKI